MGSPKAKPRNKRRKMNFAKIGIALTAIFSGVFIPLGFIEMVFGSAIAGIGMMVLGVYALAIVSFVRGVQND